MINFVHLDIDDTKETVNRDGKVYGNTSRRTAISVDLFYFQEKCYKEVADITGYEVLKVKSYIQNGKRNLKNCIERKTVNKDWLDIGMLEDYLDGKLDAKTMNRVERRLWKTLLLQKH